jgi:Cu+-exporting ATPase
MEDEQRESMSHHEHPIAEAPAVHAERATTTNRPMEKDPVCGMGVPSSSPLRSDFAGKTYYFCNQCCLERFEANPRSFVEPPTAPQEKKVPAPAPSPGVQWTCPMHPEIVRDGPALLRVLRADAVDT